MQQAMKLQGEKLHNITHLNILGAEAQRFIWFTNCKVPDTRGPILKRLKRCAWLDKRVNRVVGRLAAHLKNVHTITIFIALKDEYSDEESAYESEVDEDKGEWFRHNAGGWLMYKMMLRAFPKLERVRMAMGKIVEIVATTAGALARRDAEQSSDTGNSSDSDSYVESDDFVDLDESDGSDEDDSDW